MRPSQLTTAFGTAVPVAAVVLILTTACRTTERGLVRQEFKQPHMGTLFTLVLYAPDEPSAREASDAAFARIATLDHMMSDYDPESELMQLCHQPPGKPVRVSPELFEVCQKSQRLAELSEGAFDMTIGPVVRQWRRARRLGELPSLSQLTRARLAVGWRKVKLDARARTVTLLAPDMQLDLGGIAKGYAADQALETLRRHGIRRALVAASGDIAVGEPPPGTRGWRVSIGTPAAATSGEPLSPAEPAVVAPFAKTLWLKQAAVSTSGDAEQFVEIGGVRYSHIVDARTGVGVTNQLQVSVIARRATDTDAFATTICVLGIRRGLPLVESQPGMAALILQRTNGRLTAVESQRMKAAPIAD